MRITNSCGHFAEKNGTRTDIHGHWLKKFGDNDAAALSLYQQIRAASSYVGRIYSDTCTTLRYIWLKIFGGSER